MNMNLDDIIATARERYGFGGRFQHIKTLIWQYRGASGNVAAFRHAIEHGDFELFDREYAEERIAINQAKADALGDEIKKYADAYVY